MPKQNVAVELFYNGVWNDLVASNDVLADTPIVITRGDGDESAAPRPANISLRLNNDDDRFRTSNPNSPLYGKAGVNTPLRVSVGGVVRGYVEASSWQAGQTPDFRRSPPRGSAWVDVQGGGVLQRVNQWTELLRSPFYTYNAAVDGLVGYWPMEDAAGSLIASTPVAGAVNSQLLGMSFNSSRRAPGSGTQADVNVGDDSTFQFVPGSATSNAGWLYSIAVNMATLGTDEDYAPVFVGLANGWTVEMVLDATDETIELGVFNASASLVTSSTASYANFAVEGRWLLFHLDCFPNGVSNFEVDAWYRGVGDSVWQSLSVVTAGVTSSLSYAFGSGLPEGSTFGHVLGTSGDADWADFLIGRWDAFMGHAGERTAVRFGRLMDQRGIPYYVTSGFATSSPMGPQPVLSLPDHIREIRDTEDGLMFDHRTEGRLLFVSRDDRLNQGPALTLDARANPTGLPALPTEVTDDQGIHNLVTASQRDGGDVTVEDSTSSMSTQAPPNGRGVYQQTVKVNIEDEATDLPQVANWWLRRGTVDKPRFPQVTVDLTTLSATAIANVEAVDIGSVIQIVNYREYTIRLFVIGYVETIGTHTRSITFTCAPDQQFNVGKIGTQRLAARSTTLNAGIDSVTTSLTLKMTDVNEQWRTGANSVPVLIGGELITLGTVGAVTGSGPWTQAVTGCTRSVNGIVKAHSTGDPVTVDNTIRLILKED